MKSAKYSSTECTYQWYDLKFHFCLIEFEYLLINCSNKIALYYSVCSVYHLDSFRTLKEEALIAVAGAVAVAY